ncbi:MAG: hypothetical protein ACI3YA_02905 [Alloprevotella sp.]
MKSIKPLLLLTLIYLLLGPLLLWIEVSAVGNAALRQAWPITVIAVAFFAYHLLWLTFLDRLRSNGSRRLTQALLGGSVVRMLMALLLVVGYCFIMKEGHLLFAINLMTYYLVTLVATGLMTIKQERKASQTKQ